MKRSIIYLLILPLLFFVACENEDDHDDHDHEEHAEVHKWVILDDMGNTFMEIENPDIDSEYNTELVLTAGEAITVTVQMYDHDDDLIEDVDDLSVMIDNETVLSATVNGDQVTFVAEGTGQTEFEFQLLHDGHVDARTVKIPVTVN